MNEEVELILEDAFQCILPQHIKMSVPGGGGYLKSTTYLIAFSNDQGKQWYFLDASNKTPEQLKQIFPELSDDLIIPSPPQPEFIKK